MQSGIEAAYDRLCQTSDVRSAAKEIKIMGDSVGLKHPAVVADYSEESHAVCIGDGCTAAQFFGELFEWDCGLQRAWIEHSLYRISPIATTCRTTIAPFQWSAESMRSLALESARRAGRRWHMTPAHGIVGGITVPVHLPMCRIGSVTWITQDEGVDLAHALNTYGDLLRLSAYKIMSLLHTHCDAAPGATCLPLTEREAECIRLVALGHTDAEIARIIFRSQPTARFHIENAIKKLGARNRPQAIAIACQLGVIHDLSP